LLLLFAGNPVFADISSEDVRTPIAQTTDPKALYRLFPTHNMWKMLELNTATGAIAVLQFTTGDANMRWKQPYGGPTIFNGNNNDAGRFTLYPTTNIFNFVLLDQRTGSTWQYEWSDGGKFFPIINGTK
jgi:hypothetical protein